MNILKMQDMLKGLPDARLKQELDMPTGQVPQYLVLSEVMRRQKMRDEFSSSNAPQTTVVDDVRAMMSGQQQPMQPMQPPQQPAFGMAEGGFVNPAEAFGNAGFSGYQMQPQQKPQPPMGSLSGPTNLTPQTMPQQQTQQTVQQPISQRQGVMAPLQQYGGLMDQQMPQPMNIVNPMQQMQQQKFAKGGAVYLANGSFLDYFTKLNKAEGTGKNSRSSASGVGQFIESTWMDYIRSQHPDLIGKMSEKEILDLRKNKSLGEDATNWYMKTQIEPALRNAGLPVNQGTLYLGHFAGPGGAQAVLSADPSTPIAEVLGEKVVAANPFLEGKTAGWVANWAAEKMGGEAQPVAMAGRETSRGLGEGAGREAIGNTYDAASNEGGMGVFPEDSIWSKLRKGFAAGANDLGDAVLNPKRRYAPSGGMMKGAAQAAANYGKREMDLINAYKKAAEAALQDPGAPQFMGSGLMSLANGGPVYMANGTPDELQIQTVMDNMSLTRDEALRFIEAHPDAGLGSPEINRQNELPPPGTPFVIPETNTAPIAPETRILPEVPGVTISMEEYLPLERERERERLRLDREGFGTPRGNYTPEEAAAFEESQSPAPATPTSTPAAPKEPSEFDLYKQYMENMMRLNKEFLDERRQQAEDARGGGLGSFLRRLGIGVLSSPSGKFGDMLASGITNVASAQSKAQQEYLDRIGKLDEAELAYQLQAAKMPYELAVLRKKGSGLATSSDIQKYLIDQISDLNEKETKLLESGQLADPAELKRIRDQIAEYETMLQNYGYPARPTPKPTEVSPEIRNALGR